MRPVYGIAPARDHWSLVQGMLCHLRIRTIESNRRRASSLSLSGLIDHVFLFAMLCFTLLCLVLRLLLLSLGLLLRSLCRATHMALRAAYVRENSGNFAVFSTLLSAFDRTYNDASTVRIRPQPKVQEQLYLLNGDESTFDFECGL